MNSPNPLIDDRVVDFLLHDVLRVEQLSALPAFAEHSRESYDLFLGTVRRLARRVLYPAYRPMDAAPPEFHEGRVQVHPKMREIFPQLAALGLSTATAPVEEGGQGLPRVVATTAELYLSAGNVAACCYLSLTASAARLIEAFGDAYLKTTFLPPMNEGTWTGTMALTEPHAGSFLGDLKTAARPLGDGRYAITGSKIFISGGDHDLTENIVHMTLARIEGAPPGTRGLSLFAVPRLRPEGGQLVPNAVTTAGLVHKIGWRALPSVILNYDEGCVGWLVGREHQGLAQMFQMMNEARLMVGASGVATASAAFQESLEYARTRIQGQRPGGTAQVAIIEHPDVRRMLLRQKAIVEGGLALVLTTARLLDLAAHDASEGLRQRARSLVEILTPVAKSFPAEYGFESTTLALQIHGGYGYTTEYPPEAWMRDQKLNSIHEGTTGIQALDLLGRKVGMLGGGLPVLLDAMGETTRRAAAAGVPAAHLEAFAAATSEVQGLTTELLTRRAAGRVEDVLGMSTDFLTLFSIWVIAWQWIDQEAAALEVFARGSRPEFLEGTCVTAAYWLTTELPLVPTLAARCRQGPGTFLHAQPAWL
jgi:butyryl-CoA dehydrogenase